MTLAVVAAAGFLLLGGGEPAPAAFRVPAHPTGVAVTYGMHHGGPFPATTSPPHTSVGMTAVHRFTRPVAFQDAPAAALPPELREDNPLGIRRRVNGVPEA